MRSILIGVIGVICGPGVSAASARHLFAPPVFADGSIYFLAEQGVTTVIAPGREFRRLVVLEDR